MQRGKSRKCFANLEESSKIFISVCVCTLHIFLLQNILIFAEERKLCTKVLLIFYNYTFVIFKLACWRRLNSFNCMLSLKSCIHAIHKIWISLENLLLLDCIQVCRRLWQPRRRESHYWCTVGKIQYSIFNYYFFYWN